MEPETRGEGEQARWQRLEEAVARSEADVAAERRWSESPAASARDEEPSPQGARRW